MIRIGAPPTSSVREENTMCRFLVSTCLCTAAVFAASASYANEELIRLSQDAKQWVMPAGNYANTRYSTLK